MTRYVYLPVPSLDMEAMALKLVSHKNILRNDFQYGIAKAVQRILMGCLRGIAAADELCLIIHGREAGSRFVGEDRRGANGMELKKYSPEELARAIDKEGLIKTFRDLKLVACGGGNCAYGEKQAMPPFAQRLSFALKQRGYDHIQVTGYHGLVSVENRTIEVAFNGPQGGKYYPADAEGAATRF
jgi:hypothetical protein